MSDTAKRSIFKEILKAAFYEDKNGSGRLGFSLRRTFLFIFLSLFVIDLTWLLFFPGSHWILTLHIQGKVSSEVIETIYQAFYVIISMLIVGQTAGKMTKSM